MHVEGYINGGGSEIADTFQTWRQGDGREEDSNSSCFSSRPSDSLPRTKKKKKHTHKLSKLVAQENSTIKLIDQSINESMNEWMNQSITAVRVTKTQRRFSYAQNRAGGQKAAS